MNAGIIQPSCPEACDDVLKRETIVLSRSESWIWRIYIALASTRTRLDKLMVEKWPTKSHGLWAGLELKLSCTPRRSIGIVESTDICRCELQFGNRNTCLCDDDHINGIDFPYVVQTLRRD